MRSIFPSAEVISARYALVSSLRALGFTVDSPDKVQPAAGDMFIVTEGEPLPAPARTIIIGNQGRHLLPSRDGNPARIAY